MRVFIGLGSNLDNPENHIRAAIAEFKILNLVELKQVSPLYSSKPMGPQDQPDFINAVLELETDLTAEQLLDECFNIENKHDRIREQHWGPRTLDLDILLYGDDIIKTDRLIVPHKGLSQRNFILYPLNDIVGVDFQIPNSGTLGQLLDKCPIDGLTQLKDV